MQRQWKQATTPVFASKSPPSREQASASLRVPLPKGDCLEVIGVRVQPGSLADQCSAFADRHKFLHADQIIIPLGLAGMVNHSAKPNLVRCEKGDKLFLKAPAQHRRG